MSSDPQTEHLNSIDHHLGQLHLTLKDVCQEMERAPTRDSVGEVLDRLGGIGGKVAGVSKTVELALGNVIKVVNIGTGLQVLLLLLIFWRVW